MQYGSVMQKIAVLLFVVSGLGSIISAALSSVLPQILKFFIILLVISLVLAIISIRFTAKLDYCIHDFGYFRTKVPKSCNFARWGNGIQEELMPGCRMIRFHDSSDIHSYDYYDSQTYGRRMRQIHTKESFKYEYGIYILLFESEMKRELHENEIVEMFSAKIENGSTGHYSFCEMLIIFQYYVVGTPQATRNKSTMTQQVVNIAVDNVLVDAFKLSSDVEFQ